MKPNIIKIILFTFFGVTIGTINAFTETYDIDLITIIIEYLDNIQYFNEFFKCFENSTELTEEVTKLKDSIVPNNNFPNELNTSDTPNPQTENSIFTNNKLLFFTVSAVMFLGVMYISGGG